ncbi:MAG: MFS transporter [Pseudomonadales bacterium]|nr:MFS transporter [Pseudomonadales bacterium]
MSQASFREGIRLLARPDVAKLFTAYLITYSGSAMAPIAIAFGVLELTGSARDSAIVIAAPTIGSIVVMLFSGALADRTSRQHVMVLAEILAACSQCVIAALFLTGNATVPVLALLMLVNGTAMALNAPAQSGFVPQIVDPGELQAANSLLGTARNGATMLGAAIAGVLVALFGAGIAIAIDAATFLLSATLIASLRPRAQEPSPPASLVTDLVLGWKEFTRHEWLWTIVLQFSFLVAVMEAVFGLLGPATAKLHMNGAVDWGFIAAASGAGTIVGGIAAMRLNVSRPMLFASNCVWFFALVPLALILPLPVAWVAGAAFFGGIAGQFFAVLWYTTLQTEVPQHLLSRVSAYDHFGSIALAPLGVVAGGFLFESIGGSVTLGLAAGVVLLSTFVILLVPGVRNLRARSPQPVSELG